MFALYYSGEFGIVYKARLGEMHSSRVVAVKTLKGCSSCTSYIAVIISSISRTFTYALCMWSNTV